MDGTFGVGNCRRAERPSTVRSCGGSEVEVLAFFYDDWPCWDEFWERSYDRPEHWSVSG
jgi:hypothetical protein